MESRPFRPVLPRLVAGFCLLVALLPGHPHVPDAAAAQAPRRRGCRNLRRGQDRGQEPGARRGPRLRRGRRRDPLRRFPPLRRPRRVRHSDEGPSGRGQRGRPDRRPGHPRRAGPLQPRVRPRDGRAGLRPCLPLGPLRGGNPRTQAGRPLQPEARPRHGLHPAEPALELRRLQGQPQTGRLHRDVGRRRAGQERSRALSALPALSPEGAGDGLSPAPDRLRRREGLLPLPKLLLGHGPEHGRDTRRRLLSRARHGRRPRIPLHVPGRDQGRPQSLLFHL